MGSSERHFGRHSQTPQVQNGALNFNYPEMIRLKLLRKSKRTKCARKFYIRGSSQDKVCIDVVPRIYFVFAFRFLSPHVFFYIPPEYIIFSTRKLKRNYYIIICSLFGFFVLRYFYGLPQV